MLPFKKTYPGVNSHWTNTGGGLDSATTSFQLLRNRQGWPQVPHIANLGVFNEGLGYMITVKDLASASPTWWPRPAVMLSTCSAMTWQSYNLTWNTLPKMWAKPGSAICSCSHKPSHISLNTPPSWKIDVLRQQAQWEWYYLPLWGLWNGCYVMLSIKLNKHG